MLRKRLLPLLLLAGFLLTPAHNLLAGGQTQSARQDAVLRHITQAEAHYDQGDFRKAEQELTRALRLDPRNVDALLGRAYSRSKQERWRAALSDLNRARRFSPGDANVAELRAVAFYMLGRKPQAVAEADRLVDLRPTNLRTLGQAADIYDGCHDRQRLERVLTEMLYVEGDMKILRQRAVVRGLSGNYQGSLDDFDEIIKREPDNAGVWADRGNTLLYMKRREEALASTQKAFELGATDSPTAHFNKILILKKMGRYEESLQAAEESLALFPGQPDLLGLKGYALMSLNRYEESVQAFTKALQRSPRDFKILTNRALSLAHLGEDRAAKADLEAAFALDKSPTVRRNLAWLLAASPDDAVRNGKRALRVITGTPALPTDSGRLSIFACAYAELRDFSSAVAYAKASEDVLSISKGPTEECREEARQMTESFKNGKPWRRAFTKEACGVKAPDDEDD